MAVAAVVGIGTPILLAWWLVKKYQMRTQPLLVGAGVFVVFALVLESIVHQIVLKGPSGPAIQGNIWHFAIYGGLMAALFEESGRFLAMKFVLKKEPDGPLTGVSYGVGHGGVEMILIFGLTMISNLVISAMINTGQADTLLANVPADARAVAEAQFAQLESLSAGSLLLGLWERISALILQLALSLMVWTAVRRAGKWLWLLPAAYLLHFVVDASAVVLAKSVSTWAVEIIIFAMALAAGAIGFQLYHSRS